MMNEALEETMTEALPEEESQPEPTKSSVAASGDERGPSVEITTESVVEAILFATEEPLSAKKIADLLGTGTAKDVKQQIQALNQRYTELKMSFRVEEIAGGFQMLTLPEYNTWLSKYRETRSESKLSQAALETLAIVAYKQPVLRAEVEVIRGVAAGDMLNRLREMGLIKIVGRAEELGRPMLYGTTKRFLEVFGLAGLDDLPQIEELKAPE